MNESMAHSVAHCQHFVISLFCLLLSVLLQLVSAVQLLTGIYITRTMQLVLDVFDYEQAAAKFRRIGRCRCGLHPPARCKTALGLESGMIRDSALSASSAYDQLNVGPANARVRVERRGGAWCPKHQIDNTTYEWIQIELGQLTAVTGVETQGRFGHGQGQEFVRQYMLEYQRSRVSSSSWICYRDNTGNQTLSGNINTYQAVMRTLQRPIIARRIRLVPYSVHLRTVCLRAELYGCLWTEGLLSYSMRQGDRTADVTLADSTYDGQQQQQQQGVHWLSGGLGQLSDGVEGSSTVWLNSASSGNSEAQRAVYAWVGWNRHATTAAAAAGAGADGDADAGDDAVEIVCEFDAVRRFSAVRVHVSNMFTQHVRVFRRAVVQLALKQSTISSSATTNSSSALSAAAAVSWETVAEDEYKRDSLSESARYVTIAIPQQQHTGQYVRLRLYYDSDWMLISEIEFHSEIVMGDYSYESTNYEQRSMINGTMLHQESSAASDGSTQQQWLVGVILGSVLAAATLLSLTPLILKYQSGVTQRTTTAAATDKPSGDESVTVDVEHTAAVSDEIQCRQLPTPPPVTALSSDCYCMTSDNSTYAVIDDDAEELTSLSGCQRSTSAVMTQQQAPAASSSSSSSSSSSLVEWATLALSDHWLRGSTAGLQGRSGNSLYAVPCPPPAADYAYITEIPPECLLVVDKLGQGDAGEVCLCEIVLSADHDVTDDVTMSERRTAADDERLLVVVKTLYVDADVTARTSFSDELSALTSLQHENIARLVGVCTTIDPLCLVMEYMPYGDLKQFLQQRSLHSTAATLTVSSHQQAVSYEALLYMASQVACGMQYLQSVGVIHRDLAARNCLVGPLYRVKITDFAMSRLLFSADYYVVEGQKLLPLRWMAWESVILGKFSSASDVWSFAVTLWEVLTLCRCQPYSELDDAAVIANYRQYGAECGAGGVLLLQPHLCPSHIYDLMLQCWAAEYSLRPTFHQVHTFLRHANVHYRPELDANCATATATS